MPVFRRFEMWCRRQAAVAIFSLLLAGWLTGESSEALTTFGKSNTQAPRQATTQAPELYRKTVMSDHPHSGLQLNSARQCQKQGECAGISGTSCVRTAWDPTTRCLCGDNQPPVNGQCEATQSKNLYHLCSNSDECNDGLVCFQPNNTATQPHLRVYANNEKICLCDSENGYKEKDHSCSDADIMKTSVFAVVIVTCLRKLLAY